MTNAQIHNANPPDFLSDCLHRSEKITVVNDAGGLFSRLMETAIRETGADSGELYTLDEEAGKTWQRAEKDSLFLQTMNSLAAMQEERDPYTAGHSLRVAQIAVRIACAMGLPVEDIAMLEVAGKLHDIGKIGIPDEILLKAGPLTPQEFEIIKTHTERGRRILTHIERLQPAIEAIYCHHEWYNGGGYPRGLRGEDIPLAGAIIGVADTFDAIITDRPYRPRRSRQEALEVISRGAGVQFHPRVVAALQEAYKDKDGKKLIPILHDDVSSI
jgi:putative nucleotidyltransferase with HDIG domain